MSLTVVTGFVDVGRDSDDWGVFKRGSSSYLEHFISGVAKLNCNMIIFIEEKYMDQIRRSRDDIPSHKTKFFIMSREFIESSKAWRIYESAQKVIEMPGYHQLMDEPGRPEVSKAKYLLAMYIKFDILLKAIEMNPFGTTHYSWIDIGITHGWAPLGKLQHPFNPASLICSDDKLHAIQVEKFRDTDTNVHNYWRSKKSRIMGGYFCGTPKAFYDVTHELWKTTSFGIRTHSYVDDEQTPLAYSYLLKPSLFRLHFHDKFVYHWLDVINNINTPKPIDFFDIHSVIDFYQKPLREIYTTKFAEFSVELLYRKLSDKLSQFRFHEIRPETFHMCNLLTQLFTGDEVVITELGLCNGHLSALMTHFLRMVGIRTSSTVISNEDTNVGKTNAFFDYLDSDITFLCTDGKKDNFLQSYQSRHKSPDIVFVDYLDVIHGGSLFTDTMMTMPQSAYIVVGKCLDISHHLSSTRKTLFEVGKWVVLQNVCVTDTV